MVALSKGEVKVIGEKVFYMNEYKEMVSGIAVNISSDKFDDVKWLVSENENGKTEWACYWSKKKKMYVPVKDKDMESIYFEIKGREYSDYIYLNEVINLPNLDKGSN
jgi:hypothetical protein